MKRFLSLVLTALLLVNALGITAFAGTYNSNGTYTSTDPTDLPVSSGDTVWSGPTYEHNCGQAEHTHSNSCYALDATSCPGLGFTHWWHSSSCYDYSTPTCGRTEHQHSTSVCPAVYTWTEIEKSEAQWREWWPVYWGYDTGSEVTDLAAVSGVTAGGVNVAFTSTGVDSSEAFAAAGVSTATSGDTLRGVTINVKEGYYISSYRFVCGNHTGCHTTGHDEREHIPTVDGNYTSSFTIHPSTEVYDHWNAGDINTNPNSTYYMPWDKPTGSNIYYTFDRGSNINYPFYILFEVHEDTTSYSLTYEWGEAALTAAVPEGELHMARNSSHTVQAPSAEALAEALNLGYSFAGYQVVGSGYDADAIVQAGNTVTNYGSDITLVAQWTQKNVVTYSYTGTDVPANAPALPETVEYHVNDSVTVAAKPTLPGYTFSGWTTTNPAVTGDTFSMPDSPVHFTGEFVKDDTQTKTLTYTVKYLFNNHELAEHPSVQVTDTVWVGDADTLLWDPSYVKDLESAGWRFAGSDPAAIPTNVPTSTVITLFYVGTDVDIEIEKSVTYENGTAITDKVKVDDVLEYTITVTNNGNTTAEDVVIDDLHNGNGTISFAATAGITHSVATNTEDREVDRFVIDEIPALSSVTITYTYTVHEDDAGMNLNNYAVYYNDQGTTDPEDDEEAFDTTSVPVTERYTLTVNYYLDGVLDSARTATYTFDNGTAWNVIVGTGTATHVAPTEITSGGVHYAFDDPATTDTLSGTLSADTTVALYYATDTLPVPDGDGIPDKYQIKIEYKSETGGTITDITEEYSAIYATAACLEGDYATSGYAKVSGSVVTVDTAAGYEFKHWDVTGSHHPTLHLDGYPEDLTGLGIVANDVRGGETYIFTARMNTKKLELRKAVSELTEDVGEVIHYELHAHNMGTAVLTNVKITDVMGYKNESGFNGSIAYTETNGITYLNGVFTIPELQPGQFVNIIYTYTVRDADEGKTITNTATADYGVSDDPSATTETEINVRDRYTVVYTDGVADAEVFADQTTNGLLAGVATPAFSGTPTRANYDFAGWSPAVAATVTKSETYVAQWTPHRYTLTVEHYLDGVLDSASTKTFTENFDTAWNIVVGAGTATYNAPAEITSGGVTYVFDDPATTDTLSGTYAANVTVKLYYATDANDDDVPDKYQIKTEFKSDNGGTIVGEVVEYSTIYRTNEYLPGDYATTGYAKVSGRKVTVNTGYVFKEWNVDHAGAQTVVLGYPADMTAETITYTDAQGGDVYTVTARLNVMKLEINKNVSDRITNVGDTITYTIYVNNTGTADLTNITITDVADFTGTIDAATVTGATYAGGVFTIASLKAGEYVNITYNYVVLDTDEGNTITNTATADYGVDPKPTATIRTTVNVRDRYVVVYTDGVAGAEVFADQTTDGLLAGAATPAFSGTPARDGYTFIGWSPAVAATVTESVTYVAQWRANPTVGTLILTKVDANDASTKLSGVEFMLYKSEIGEDRYIGKYTTNEKGEIREFLVGGEYYLIETKAAAGYKLDSTRIAFTITVGAVTGVTVTNEKTPVPPVFTDEHYAYIIGREDGLVHPEASITRAEVATIFFRLLSDDVRNANLTKVNNYTDVNDGDWHAAAVSTLTAMGILNGYDGTFRPDNFITRAEFAAIAARFDTNGNDTGASFSDIYGHWGQREISIAANNGWVLGYEDGTFKPDQYITRAEAITLVNRVLQRIPESVDDLLDSMIQWPDNMDTTAWYYLAIQEATNSHSYTRKVNGYESWVALIPNRDWKIFEE